MADDVAVRDALGSVRQVSALETGPGKVVQRQLVQTVVGGVPVDVSSAAPVPVTGPQTDAQARASPQPVSGPLTDVQLRAAQVPVSPMLYNGATWEAASTGRTPVALLSEAARTGIAYLPGTLCPGACTRAVIVVNVVSAHATEYLQLSVIGGATQNVILAGLRIAGGSASGAYGISLGAGASIGTAAGTNPAVLASGGTYSCVHSPAPVPRSLAASYVQPQTSGSWTYSVSLQFLP